MALVGLELTELDMHLPLSTALKVYATTSAWLYLGARID